MKEIKVQDKILTFELGDFGDVENLFDLLDEELKKVNPSCSVYGIIDQDLFTNALAELVFSNKKVRDQLLICGKHCKIDNQDFCYSYFVEHRYLYFNCLINIAIENILAFMTAPSL